MTILQSKRLSEIPNIAHGFTTRREDLPDQGNVSLIQGDPDTARKNRRTFTQDLGVEEAHLTFSYQEHGTTIREVKWADRGAGALEVESSLSPADGLITSQPDLPLAIMVADCACLLISDLEGSVVGAFHAGWRGVYEEMPQKAVQTFTELYRISPADLAVWISPMICGNCFKVGRDIWDRFKERWGNPFLLDEPPRVDLPKLLAHQLTDGGVLPDNIDSPGLCTYEGNRFFSHRRGETPNGRMMGVIMSRQWGGR